MSEVTISNHFEVVRDLTDERDHWIRLFNRVEAAISHHKKATATFATDADEALYAARDRILRDAANPP